jgi:outer membrane protein insertion porin family
MFKKQLIFFLLLVFLVPVARAQITIGQSGGVDYSNPREYIIGGITISGVKYLDANVLIMLSGLAVGEKVKIPSDKITTAIRKLWDQGLFEDIQVSVSRIVDNQVFLDIKLKERPRLSKFQFSGIKKSDADDIRDKIRLVKGEYVTDNMILKTKNIIRKFYTDKGFLNVQVNIQQKKDTSAANDVMLIIGINKNERVKIYQITLHGNTQLSNELIRAAMKKTKEKSIFNPMNDMDGILYKSAYDAVTMDFVEIANVIEEEEYKDIRLRIFKSSKFIPEDYEEDKLNLIKKYNALGYRDARIIRDSISNYDESTVNVDIWVDEGPKYYIRNITWVGNTKYNADVLNHFLKLKKGDVYDQETLETALSYNPNGADIRSLYMDDGYLFFDVVPVETRVENDSIDLEIRMKEGKQATISKVTVKGNTKTNDHVALREVSTRPGQLFSRDNLIRSQRQLAQLKYFNAEKLTPNVNPRPEEGLVDVEYGVEETSADQVELSGGWGYGRIIGTLGLSFNNFSLRNITNLKAWKPIPAGDGQKLSVRFQTYGKGYYSYSFSFTEPWVGGKKPLALSLSYVHSRYTNGLANTDPNFGFFKIDGVSVGLGSQLKWPDNYFTLYQSFNYNKYTTKNYGTIFSFATGDGTYDALSYSVVLSRNSIDAPIYPRTGSEMSITGEVTPPYSLFRGNVDYNTMTVNERYKWVEFWKFKFKGAWYINLIDKLVLTPRIQFGVLGAYNYDLGVTPFQRFYLGGDGLTGYNNMDGRELIGMRGYANNSLTPDYPNNTTGGTVYTRYILELRYPISLNPSATIYGLAFMEAGNDWLYWREYNPFDVYRSVGVGIRVFLPMFGLLGLDWGYGLDPVPNAPGSNGSQFHFSINSSID